MARPKKRIVLIDADENGLSVRRLVLETWGFAVEGAANGAEARALLEQYAAELAVVVWRDESAADVRALLEELRLRPEMRALLVSEARTALPDWRWEWPSLIKPVPRELIDRVLTLAARRRGPKRRVADASETASAAGRAA